MFSDDDYATDGSYGTADLHHNYSHLDAPVDFVLADADHTVLVLQDENARLCEEIVQLNHTLNGGWDDLQTDGDVLFRLLCTTAARIGLDADEFAFWLRQVRAQMLLVNIAPAVSETEPPF